jgi:hypothetical protein
MLWYEHIMGVCGLVYCISIPVQLWAAGRVLVYSEALYMPLTGLFWWECSFIWRMLKDPLRFVRRKRRKAGRW